MKIIILILSIAAMVACGPGEEKQATVVETKKVVEPQKQELPLKLTDKEMFFESFAECKGYAKNMAAIDEMSDIWNHQMIMDMYILNIDAAKKLNDKTLSKDIKTFEDMVSKLQKKEYPNWRKAYLGFIKQKLFRYNVDVRKGGNYDIVEFISGDFMDNAVVEDCNNMMWEKLNKLRFKKVVYSWNTYGDRSVSYKVKTPVDSKIVY